MKAYSGFARHYDRLMDDVDYKAKAAYLLKLFKKHGKTPTLLLDLACGTGGFSNQMALQGVEVIGVDASEEMLACARENSALLGTDVLYLCQRAEKLDLYGTVDGAICCLDSLNHITDINNLRRALSRVSLFLEKGGLFIFDVNTVYKHKAVLADNTFVIEREGVYCVWQNRFNEKKLITDIYLDFFTENDGLYERESENFYERAYTDDELNGILAECGLEIRAVYDDYTLSPPSEKTERKIYVTEKIRN